MGQFTLEELDLVIRKNKIGNDEIPPEVLKTRKFDDDILLRCCNAVYNRTQYRDEQREESCISPRRVT